MTAPGDSPSTTSEAGGGRFVGSLLLGILAMLVSGMGIWWAGMTGYVWKDGRLWGSSSWDDEAELGTAAAILFFSAWALLMLVAIIVALTGARRARAKERRDLLALAAAMPVVSIALIMISAPLLLGPGGAQVIPLDQLL